jgi:hypothetical protein
MEKNTTKRYKEKPRTYKGECNKALTITNLITSGYTNIHDIKQEADKITGKNIKLSYIKEVRSRFKKTVKAETINNSVNSLKKADKESIKQAVRDAIYTIAVKTKDLKEEKHIADLFSDILHIGAGK